MKSDLHVIANASQARLVQAEAGRVAVLEQLEPDSGRGPNGAAYPPRLDPYHRDSLQFACEIAHRLERLVREGRVGALHLYAPEPFLGEMEQSLGSQARRLLADAHTVDLSRVGPAELERRMREQVAQPH